MCDKVHNGQLFIITFVVFRDNNWGADPQPTIVKYPQMHNFISLTNPPCCLKFWYAHKRKAKFEHTQKLVIIIGTVQALKDTVQVGVNISAKRTKASTDEISP